MSRYKIILRAFDYLEKDYKFIEYMSQKYGAYYYVAWTNGKKDIMVLYDDRINEQIESPVWIRIFNSDCFGTAYDDVTEFRNEFYTMYASPKERIYNAANWLRKSIEKGLISIS